MVYLTHRIVLDTTNGACPEITQGCGDCLIIVIISFDVQTKRGGFMRKSILLILFAFFLSVSLVLAACGGGGGGVILPGISNAPVANAGDNQSITTGTKVTLNGGASSDADGNALTYSWTMTASPSGSTAILTDATTATPYFTPNVDGTYIISLVVNNGTVNSTADTVTITATTGGGGNTAPVANAGANKDVTTGLVAFLNGSSSSDADGNTLTYSWAMTTSPSGSTASLTDATTATPYFTPNVDGAYTISLVVNDGTVDSSPATVTLTAKPVNVEAMAVGAWQGSANCGSFTMEFGWLLCPDNRLRGYEKINSFDYLDCGTWSTGTVTSSGITYPSVTGDYTYTAVLDKTVTGTDSQTFVYWPGSDALQWYHGCTLHLQRLVGGVTEADCTSATCTAGGSGAITGCGTDADCGKCWYCDAGTCRYGGEGPYGCYRGWEPPQ
jgi:hypothetical protein